jgi:hypothetical protein
VRPLPNANLVNQTAGCSTRGIRHPFPPPALHPPIPKVLRILPIGFSVFGTRVAPSRRRFAASVFPLFGLRPNGEDRSLQDWGAVADRHERLVVPRPDAAGGLRSTGSRSAPRRVVT